MLFLVLSLSLYVDNKFMLFVVITLIVKERSHTRVVNYECKVKKKLACKQRIITEIFFVCFLRSFRIATGSTL